MQMDLAEPTKSTVMKRVEYCRSGRLPHKQLRKLQL